ncbi:hypothetical protein AB0A77_01930 [Streptomyces varsoviensis]|uniref:hypothetical protein n=1 Tax=Streptomyces varsoviensis TaxID=67373 RepID=UPI0033BFD0DA
MQTIPTGEDIKARRTVRFARGHLSKYAGWTGTLVGYNDLYDSVHVYVNAPGNPESGSKITYSRKDAEFCDEKGPRDVERREVPDIALTGHRETTLRVAGVEHVVRTERGGKIRTVKQLEAAHTKAVKAAINAARQADLDAEYADMVAAAQKPRKDKKGFPGSGERARQRLLDEADAWRSKYGTAKPVKSVPCGYVDARKGFPKVTYTSVVPDYLVEIEPGHYATTEAAESMGAMAAPASPAAA